MQIGADLPQMANDCVRFATVEVGLVAARIFRPSHQQPRSPTRSHKVHERYIEPLDLPFLFFLNTFLLMYSIRFGPSLRYIELPIELITHTVLHELGSKCPNLTHMLLDFSTAMQLHDFNELQVRGERRLFKTIFF